ncbi:methyltransferase [Marinobacter zhejiangensis]|uniref:Methyltransferase domain-containing protein n=1 Tax=Marinobacter zhejiangensis TaxID=488535 RepID=A0A1I4L8I9_9GAMM|nr:methyltransferase [Marinobacter zhejiangensis]SFL87189.1 Methyltransferase domain-containing protein [Marinobacter zhejiangensis]
MPDNSELLQRWQRLNQWLLDHQGFWQPVPFTTPSPDWMEAYPELSRWLDHLDDQDCQRYHEDVDALARALAPMWPAMTERVSLLDWPHLEAGDVSLPERLAVDMPGRKRQQAGAFASALIPLAAPVLDWCCGKGHLARTLSRHTDSMVQGLEWDETLVAEGNRLATKADMAVHLRQQDVMEATLAFPQGEHGVALHACGELHRHLLRQGVAGGAARLSISPCCYHLGLDGDYPPMSHRVGAVADVCRLSNLNLRLVVQETVTAPARVRTLRVQTEAWRLGFDALQRSLRGCDDYLPVPSHPTRLNQQGFAAFCVWAAEQKGLSLPSGWQPEHWLAEGRRRQRQVRRHELVRHLFRRPLELWLVLDYGLYLEEQGYQVRLGTFCRRELTPRNLLIDARRRETQV